VFCRRPLLDDSAGSPLQEFAVNLSAGSSIECRGRNQLPESASKRVRVNAQGIVKGTA
jgi:hypothetical protein